MRSSSGGKFSLGSAFGRRDKHDRTGSYSGNDFGVPNTAETTQTNSRINGAAFNEPDSPNARSGGEGGGSGGGVQLKKLGKTFAHNNLLPGLGNKDLKALQDVIAAEKGVLSNTEKLAVETQKAASVLPNYGLQEGPDLQDVLTQSSHLLNHFSAALNVYAERQVSLRGSYKKIRDREETFSELRSQRRSTGSKAETAERKLAKMGPENKGLVSQTELLERLRQEMRTMDSEIVKEETALGDFKRQIVKEAFMYKFSGLEELGEKLCIIGEMGKLVIDEIPLEETPVGYGRAPYGGFTKTETAVEEAGRCLGQVKFAAVETTLKPSHLPHAQHLPGRTSVLHRQESISAAEEFAHFPAGMTSPQTPGRQDSFAPPPNGGTYGLDENPYGGIDNRATNSHNAYGEYGGVRGDSEGDSRRQTLWQGPTEDALRQQNRASDGIEYAQSRIASMYGPPLANGNGGGAAGERGPVVSFGALPTPSNPHPVAEEAEGQDYEHQQQAELDRQHEHEQAAWREQSDQTRIAGQHDAPLPNPYDTERTGTDHAAAHSAMSPPWQPLNVKRDKSITPEPRALHDPPVAPYISEPTTDSATGPGYTQSDYHSEAHSAAPSELIPPPSMAQLHARAPTPGTEGFRTPAESPSLDTAASYTHSAPTIPAFSQFALQPPIATPTAPTPPSPPLPVPVPGFTGGARPASPSAMSPSAGKMSAGAFRKAAPRRSETAATVNGDEEGSGSDVGRGSRRLPVPPGGYTPGVAGPSGMISPGLNAPGAWPDEKRTLMGQKQDDVVGVEDERGAPPSYAHGASAGQHDESLR